MAQVSMTVRMDSQLKQNFDVLCARMGMSVNAAINIFANAVVRTRSIPFMISANPMEVEDQALREFREFKNMVAASNKPELTLDEINLLPYDTLRFMQGLLDGKEVVEYLGQTINIHPDFKVIGTMNLMVDGRPYGLPEPLVDRCSDIQEFKMTGKFLANAIF